MTIEVLEFSPLYMSKLSNDYVYAVTSSTISKANTYASAFDPVSKAILASFILAHTDLEAAIKKLVGSLLTIKITDADVLRDGTHNSICRGIKYYLKDEDSSKKAAATELKRFFDPYWDIPGKAIDVQTQLTKKLMLEYKASVSLQQKAALLGLDTKFATLETQNNVVETLYDSRTTEQTAESSASATSLRPVVEKLYDKFCMAISLAASFTPSDDLTQLFGEMDNVRKKYNALVVQTDSDSGTTTTQQQTASTTK